MFNNLSKGCFEGKQNGIGLKTTKNSTSSRLLTILGFQRLFKVFGYRRKDKTIYHQSTFLEYLKLLIKNSDYDQFHFSNFISLNKKKMEQILLREFRKMPFCWQDKSVLRKINGKAKRKELNAIRSTYLALTEIASNQENEKISIYLFDLAQISGLSEKTISKCLDYLKSLGVVFIQPQERGTDGKYKSKEIWLISENVTAGKIEETSKKVQRKLKKTLGVQVSDNREDSLEDIIENSLESSVEEEGEKKASPPPHKNIDFINGMRDVEIRGGCRIKQRNVATDRSDVMTADIKKAMYATMKSTFITNEDFEKRAKKFRETLLIIEDRKLRNYIFYPVREYDLLQFLQKINRFYGDIALILSKIAVNEYKKKVISMLKPSIASGPAEDYKKKVFTPEEKKEVLSKLKETINKYR